MAKTQDRVLKVVIEYLTEVNRKFPVDKAILFGSHAQARSRKHSDIDVAIFSKSVTTQNRLEAMTEIILLTRRFQSDIQPVIFPYEDYLDAENEFIAREVKANGVELI